MKRLMFPVSGLVALAVLSGCVSTLNGKDGEPLRTPGGAIIEIVDDPVNAPPPVHDNNATFAERMKAEADYAAKTIQISEADAETAARLRERVVEEVKRELRAMVAAGSYTKLMNVMVYVNGRPQISSELIRRLAGKDYTPGVEVALRAMMIESLDDFLKTELYPKMVSDTVAKIDPVVKKCVSTGNFAKARELIWRASTRGIPEVDGPVREKMVEVLQVLVNPTNLQKLEPRFEEVFQKAVDAKDYDGGIAKLEGLCKESIVKEYSELIDKRLAAVRDELQKVGVAEADMQSVIDKQSALIAEAADIKDARDEVQKKGAAGAAGLTAEEAKKDPALAEYYRRLEDYHKTLIQFNCRKENADKLVTKLDDDLRALVALMRRAAAAKSEAADGEEPESALYLGTRGLNDRIRALASVRIEKLKALHAAEIQAEYLKRLEAAKSGLEAKVRALVAEGKFAEARELIWDSSISGEAQWDADMFELGLSLLRDLVNPGDWARIEKEINAKFGELSATGKFDELEAYLKSYPRIRQHSSKLDAQLARVRTEAEQLGADAASAEAAAKAACGAVTEAERLVDHLDKLTAEEAVTGKPLDRSKLEAELKAYAEKLAAYHATPANVQKIVNDLSAALDSLIKEPTNPKTTRLVLGTNAVNDRIGALIEKLLASIAETRTKWQIEEHARVVTDLEKRVRQAVREQRFDDARNYIRDEKLIGRDDLDLSLYELRVGLLDSCVNPAQLDYLLAEIDAKVAELLKAKNAEGAREYIENYPYVHDRYEEIETALTAVKKAMLALDISEEESDADTKRRFFDSIQKLLEQRRESWKPEYNLSEVERALSEVAKALFAHLNKHPELIENERKAEQLHIMQDLAEMERTVTTWELNELLRARLAIHLKSANHALALESYSKLLEEIDADICFDSQISIAEEAISRQLGVKCKSASFEVNALVGEYARLFRLLKKGVKLSSADATSILVGAAYLDQAQVIRRALELGAEIDGAAARDPFGRTALAMAIDAGHSALVKPLVEAGASLTAADKDGNAIIHYAAKAGNLSVLKVVTAGAPVNVKNCRGCTPLSVAVVRNQAPIVEFLVAAVDEGERAEFVNSRNADDDSAFDIAAKFGSRDVLDALAKAGAEYGTKDLLIAEREDHVAIAQWLVNQGQDVNAEGVMAAACPVTLTGRYLIAQGGVAQDHVCKRCHPEEDAEKDAEKAEKAGVSDKVDAIAYPVDVLLRPRQEKAE